MARRHKHEEHANHEAWAIPYGDLVTLLLAFFVVMYAISTLNEGKYRAVSSALNAAFKGAPRSLDPVQVGQMQLSPGNVNETGIVQPDLMQQAPKTVIQAAEISGKGAGTGAEHKITAMDEVINQVESTMANLIEQQMLVVNRRSYGVEIEIRTDILFPSGSATVAPSASAVLGQLADTLKVLPYPMRVEGHTDNVPINTLTFPSNWELSAARAASVVHLFTQRGMDPSRLSVIGLGEFHPQGDNNTVQGRNANRRVLVVILSNTENKEDADAINRALSAAAPTGSVSVVTSDAADTGAVATPATATASPSSSPSVSPTINVAPSSAVPQAASAPMKSVIPNIAPTR